MRRDGNEGSAMWMVVALIVLGLAAATVFFGMRGETRASVITGGGGKAVLNVYSWSEYFDEELVREFEKANNCKVIIDIFSSNEEANVRIQNGASGYDILTPSSYMVSLWRKQGLLLPLDRALIPNAAKVDTDFLRYTEDPGMAHSVPYTRTVTGVGYDVEKLGENPDPTWAVFADERFKGRMTMLDDPREMFAAALKYLAATKGGDQPGRYDINTVNDAEIDEARELLIQWKKNLARFDVDGAKSGLEDGTFFVVQQYNGDMARAMATNPNVRFFVPKEGSALASDDFVILKDAPNPGLAHRFIDFMLEPVNAARNMAGIMYYMPVPEALAALEKIAPELAANPAFNIPNSELTRCSVLRDIGDGFEKYSRAYDLVIDAEQ